MTITTKLKYVLQAFLVLPLLAHSIEIKPFTLAREDGSNVDYYLVNASDSRASDVLLLVLQGSDCNSVLNIQSIFSDYRNVLPTADLLLVEKYGITSALPHHTDPEREDCPKAYLDNDSPQQRVDDVNAVLSIITEKYDYTHYVVIGGSEGAIITDLLVSTEPTMIDAAIAFNGGGRWFLDDVLHNISQMSGDQASTEIAGFRQFYQHIVNNPPFEIAMSGHGYHWWRQMLTLDHENILSKVKIPLLLVQGGRDKAVSAEKVDHMVKNLRAAGKNNISYLVYDDLDHGFKAADGASHVKRVTKDLSLWLNKQL